MLLGKACPIRHFWYEFRYCEIGNFGYILIVLGLYILIFNFKNVSKMSCELSQNNGFYAQSV